MALVTFPCRDGVLMRILKCSPPNLIARFCIMQKRKFMSNFGLEYIAKLFNMTMFNKLCFGA